MAKKSSATISRRRKILMRVLAVSAVAVVVVGILAAVGFHILQGWRARDLAAKALQSFEQANYRAAWLQVSSARNLRPDEPAVLRASAIIESRFGMPSAMENWDRYAETHELSAEDLVERGRAAAALGDEAQFQRAVDGLDAAGDAASAGRLRTVRSLARGDLDRAIEEARRAVAATDNPAMKLDLARLILRRHVDQLAAAPQAEESQRTAAEMFAIIDSLQGTEKGDEALAFGLTFLLPGQDGQERWANLAMKNASASNPALLPAATVMIDLGKTRPEDMHAQLRPIFDAAPLDRRAAFVAWLTRQNMPREALTLVTAQEAGESVDAFSARTAALGKMDNWTAVIETADAGGNAPLSMRLVTKARAEYALRQQAQSGAKSLADAVRAAAREGILPTVVATGDEMGGQAVVDATLIELCGDPGFANDAFRLTRDRFSRRGASMQTQLAEAHQRAMVAAPNAVSVQDYARYVKLLTTPDDEATEDEIAALAVSPEDTAQAVAAAPNDPAVRATHALALLKAGRAEDALGAFDDLTVFFGRVPPALQAVICLVLAGQGRGEFAMQAAQSIDQDKLTKEERLLLSGMSSGRGR
jgi:tetratricopeptide (TPR) repeat protein